VSGDGLHAEAVHLGQAGTATVGTMNTCDTP
jgi:hypothetical protein